MLTEVKDHLTGVLIPVRHIEPGTEGLADQLATCAALALSAQTAEAEADAIEDGQLTMPRPEECPPNCTFCVDTWERGEAARDALVDEVLALEGAFISLWAAEKKAGGHC
jgi:hypothetical protein